MFSGTVVSSTSIWAPSMRRRTRSSRCAYSSREKGSSFGTLIVGMAPCYTARRFHGTGTHDTLCIGPARITTRQRHAGGIGRREGAGAAGRSVRGVPAREDGADEAGIDSRPGPCGGVPPDPLSPAVPVAYPLERVLDAGAPTCY